MSRTNAPAAPAATTKTLTDQGRVESAQANVPPIGIGFDNLGGEAFVGLNVLALEIDEADGPFTMDKIEDKDFGTKSTPKVIGVYHCKKGNTPIQMPISGSFIKKANEAALAPGDVFYVKRGRNFKSKEYGTDNCKSFMIKVTNRAAK